LGRALLGRALTGRDRASYTVSTKVGRALRPRKPEEPVDAQGFVDTPDRVREWRLTRDGIRATLESSLDRLGLESVDIVYLHDVENHIREVYETAFPALAELRDQKRVRAIGFGMNHSDVLARFVADLDVDVVL
ncbi:aldo/keto reductase, partial [Streptomyces sp. MCAF7]